MPNCPALTFQVVEVRKLRPSFPIAGAAFPPIFQKMSNTKRIVNQAKDNVRLRNERSRNVSKLDGGCETLPFAIASRPNVVAAMLICSVSSDQVIFLQREKWILARAGMADREFILCYPPPG